MTDDEEGYGDEALSILYPEGDLDALLPLVDAYAEWRAEQDEDYDLADYEGEHPTIDLFTAGSEDFVTYIYENLDSETLEYANGRWEALKLSSAPAGSVYVLTGVIVGLLVLIFVGYLLLRRYRAKFY